MVVTCDIQFDNNSDGCFYAGQVINGKVTLSADKLKQVKAVVLRIKGFAHNEWSEKDSSDKSSTTYTGHMDYIDTLTYLLGIPGSSDESVIIQPGIHSFNFVCHIPTNCPSSFESAYGHIRYLVQVSLIRPWKFNTKFTRGFTVLKIMNLNYDTPLLKMPVTNQMNKVFCCGPLKSNPLQMLVQLPHSGFVPGENIPVGIIVTNDTKAKIQEICLRLVMMVCLYSQSPRVHTKNENITICKLKGDSVLPLCKKQFNYLLPVPATPPTCFNVCRITQIAYRLEVEAKIKDVFYANQEIHIAVTIGNVPLRNVIQMQPMRKNEHARMLSSEGSDQVDSVTIPQGATESNRPPWSENENTPPPVYMEAIYMPHAALAVAAEHDYGEETFTPKYPVFNIPKTASEEPAESAGPSNTVETNKSTWL